MATTGETLMANLALSHAYDFFGVSATYYAGGVGDGVAVSLIWAAQGTSESVDEVGKLVNEESALVTVQKTDIASPGIGDTVSYGSMLWEAVEVSREDSNVSVLRVVARGEVATAQPGLRRV